MTTYFVGGASRGIGFNLVKYLLQTPENKVIASVRDKTNTQLLELKTNNLTIIELDYTASFEEIKASVDTIETQFPNGVDVIISNAGIFPDAPEEEIGLDDLKLNFEVNFFGAAKIYNAIKPHWIKHDNGVQKKFFFISSSLGSTECQVPSRPIGYGTSKAALIYLANALSVKASSSSDKLFHDSIIAAVCPGLVATDMTSGGRLPDELMKYASTPESAAENIIENIVKSSKSEYNGAFIQHTGVIFGQ